MIDEVEEEDASMPTAIFVASESSAARWMEADR